MLRSRESKLGARLDVVTRGSDLREASEGGKSSADLAGSEGSWWSSEVRMWELWMVRGSSMRMSWYLRPDFWIL